MHMWLHLWSKQLGLSRGRPRVVLDSTQNWPTQVEWKKMRLATDRQSPRVELDQTLENDR